MSARSSTPTSQEIKQRRNRDIHTRLHSIAHDITFIDSLRDSFPGVKVIPNLRCGAWYVRPSSPGVEVYFKSTDGHSKAHAFSLRRPNLPLLQHFAQGETAVMLVDSTREVLNAFLSLSSRLFLPDFISLEERTRIEDKLPEWVLELQNSTYTPLIRELGITKPLRCTWVTPSTPVPLLNPNWNTIICVSASKVIRLGIEGKRPTKRGGGHEHDEEEEYIQGAGDDHELWGFGLTPELWWKHQDTILQTPMDDMLDVIRGIVAENMPAFNAQEAKVLKGSRFSVSLLHSPNLEYITLSSTPNTSSPNVLPIHTPLSTSNPSRRHLIQMIFPNVLAFITAHEHETTTFYICGSTGTDLFLGIALFILSLPPLDSSVTKKSVQQTLEAMIASGTGEGLSRAMVKAVNEFLIPRP